MRWNLSKFLLAFCLVTAGAVGVAWLTGPHVVMASVGTIVLLIIAWPVAAFLLGLAVGVLAGFCSGDGGTTEIAEAAVKGGVWYYPRLLSCNKLTVWGSLVAGILATTGLYLYVEHAIRPKEAAAREHLAEIAEELQRYHRQEGRFPEPKGSYLYQALECSPDDVWRTNPLRDPWSRPLRYTCVSREEADTFAITSTGWNGKLEPAGGDDIVECRVKVKPAGVGKKLLKAGVEKALQRLKRR